MMNVKLENGITLTVPGDIADFVFKEIDEIPRYYLYSMPDKYRTPKEMALAQMEKDFAERGNDYVAAICYIGYFVSYQPMDFFEYSGAIIPKEYMQILDTR